MSKEYPNTYRKARPTTYRGTHMRSRLEAGYAQWLDGARFTWQYEPRAFAGTSGQYLPDFLIGPVVVHFRDEATPREPRTAYVEVKPEAWPFDGAEEPLWSQMAVIHESEPESLLIIERPGLTVLVLNDPFAAGELMTIPMLWVHSISGDPRASLIDDPEPFEPPWRGQWWKR